MIGKCREQKSLSLPWQWMNDDSITSIDKPITKEMLPCLVKFMESYVLIGMDEVVQSIMLNVRYSTGQQFFPANIRTVY